MTLAIENADEMSDVLSTMASASTAPGQRSVSETSEVMAVEAEMSAVKVLLLMLGFLLDL